MFAVAQETDFKKEKKRIKQEQKEIRNLNLNDNQGQQVKDINSRYKDEHKAISKNDALTQQQKQEQIQALNKRRVDEIHNLIGQDKAKDWAGMKKNDKNKMKDKAKDKEDKVKDKQREKKVKEEKGKKEKKEKKNGKG
jgi:broad specificity phosphatase PhoE